MLLQGNRLRICNISADHATCPYCALIKLDISLKVFIDPCWIGCLIILQVIEIKGLIGRLISRYLNHALFEIGGLRDLMPLPLKASFRLNDPGYHGLLLVLITALEHL
jgi:hypothetical protein